MIEQLTYRSTTMKYKTSEGDKYPEVGFIINEVTVEIPKATYIVLQGVVWEAPSSAGSKMAANCSASQRANSSTNQ